MSSLSILVMDEDSGLHAAMSLSQFGLVFFSLFLTTLVHELAHAMTLISFGGRTQRLGVMVFYLVPAFFCDVSDAWRLPPKKRAQIAFAGILAQTTIGTIALLIGLILPNKLAVCWLPLPAHSSILHRHSGAEIIIIDTPPSNQADVKSAVDCADFTITPTKPGLAELERTLETIAYLDPLKSAVLLTQVEHTNSTKNMREKLAGKVNLFETEIPKRKEIRRGYGTVFTKFFGYEKVVAELLEEVGGLR